MYGIYAYIGVVLGVNVGIYGIHGVSGSGFLALVALRDVQLGLSVSKRSAVHEARTAGSLGVTGSGGINDHLPKHCDILFTP